ncbi:Modifier of mdg4 [Operophtera brumata]|uniref:Modifier of mdg4 n=1 Tax=Operophtera brumata TaxID=104452 RepID=A0A0L7LFM3_OPEBR|nr:Modifier of mdg4 [Operophtera brumata]
METTSFVSETIHFGAAMVNTILAGFTAVVFVTSRRGKEQIIYKRHRYYHECARGDKIRWKCPKKGCMAFCYTVEGAVVEILNYHQHLVTYIVLFIFAALFVTSSRGYDQIFYKGFKFYKEYSKLGRKSNGRWRCTKRKCKAFIHTLDSSITHAYEAHDHN